MLSEQRQAHDPEIQKKTENEMKSVTQTAKWHNKFPDMCTRRFFDRYILHRMEISATPAIEECMEIELELKDPLVAHVAHSTESSKWA